MRAEQNMDRAWTKPGRSAATNAKQHDLDVNPAQSPQITILKGGTLNWTLEKKSGMTPKFSCPAFGLRRCEDEEGRKHGTLNGLFHNARWLIIKTWRNMLQSCIGFRFGMLKVCGLQILSAVDLVVGVKC